MTPSPSPLLDDRELRCVLAVAESGSLRGAAREMGIAPSAVQRTIAAAERRLGEVLFERSAHGARVTRLGEIVVRHAHERRDLEAVFAEQVARSRRSAAGQARLAVGLGFIEQVSEHVIGSLQASHPDVALTVSTGGTEAMIEALVTDTADVAIALHPPTHPQVQVVRMDSQGVGLAAAEDHPLMAGRGSTAPLDPAQLSGHPFAVMARGYGLRALHEEFVRIHGIEAPIALETDSQAILTRALAGGELISLLPPVFLSPAPPGRALALRDVDDDHLRAVRSAILVRRDRRLPPAARALLHACLAMAAR